MRALPIGLERNQTARHARHPFFPHANLSDQALQETVFKAKGIVARLSYRGQFEAQNHTKGKQAVFEAKKNFLLGRIAALLNKGNPLLVARVLRDAGKAHATGFFVESGNLIIQRLAHACKIFNIGVGVGAFFKNVAADFFWPGIKMGKGSIAA